MLSFGGRWGVSSMEVRCRCPDRGRGLTFVPAEFEKRFRSPAFVAVLRSGVALGEVVRCAGGGGCL